ncbi:MAG TPA: hypothetical protein VFV98_12395 [Vicinamibacterales bacterium]|nr:hypothetical protein [Vicinamibacterales bacterium]
MHVRRVAVITLLLLLPWSLTGQSANSLPDALTDPDFWSLTEKFSEPDGYFQSTSGSPDNLLSNENTISTVAAQLAARLKPGGVYLGVGPEQNFTYIAAIKPKIAFITDIRRGNLHLHLIYKALFELSANRAEFVGRLFTRQRPSGLTAESSARALMDAYLDAQPGDARAFDANLQAILTHLSKTRHLPLTAADAEGIEYVLANFHRFGPAIHYTSSIGGTSRSSGTYAAIQSARDSASGAERTYLANEENFAFIKDLESRNLIVPIVGDFAGPKALRALGAYLKQRGATVTAFYVSNVEQYLRRNDVWDRFCANVASLPLDANSTFIRPDRNGFGAFGTMSAETAGCGR